MKRSNPDVSLVAIERELRRLSGDATTLASPSPALISAREVARWLRVSAPTASKLLREAGILRARARQVPITRVATFAPVSTDPCAPLDVVVFQPGHPWARAAVAAGLAQALGLIGESCVLIEMTPHGPLRGEFGSAWPRAALALQIDPDRAGLAVIEVPSVDALRVIMAVGRAALVLIPHSTTPRGLLSAAEAVGALARQGDAISPVIRLLPWPSKASTAPSPALNLISWRGLPDLDILADGAAPLSPLGAMPDRVPDRAAQAFRIALADLAWWLRDVRRGE